MIKSRKIGFVTVMIMILASASFLIVFQSSFIPRQNFSIPEASIQGWDEILSNPRPITIETYSTGIMQTDLSGIMNLAHDKATDMEDRVVEVHVNASIIQHQEFGVYLIDAGLDSSYRDNPYGTYRGMLVKNFLGKGSQKPNTNIAAILAMEDMTLRGVWLTHLHPDHTAGIVDLPKDIPYIMGKGERYVNFRFLMQGDHLAEIKNLFEIDFTKGIDLSPFGKCADLFGDGSLWAIESSGHSKGHVMYFINGIGEQVLVTGDACNDQDQFDSGIGPGKFSNDIRKAQQVLESIILFKERYPQVRLSFGHDL